MLFCKQYKIDVFLLEIAYSGVFEIPKHIIEVSFEKKL